MTAPSTPTLRNWNVNDLLGSPLLQGRVRYDRRHFHQPFHHSPRKTTRTAFWDPVKRDLGHGDNLLVQRRRIDLPQNSTTCSSSPSAAQDHRGSARRARNPRCAPKCAAEHPAVAAPQREVSAGRQAHPRRRPSCSTPCLPPWGGGVIWPVALFISLSSSLLLAFISPRGAAWCANAARAWAIDCCSCRQAARSRRPLRRWAAPVLGCQLRSISQQSWHNKKEWARLSQTPVVVVVVVSDARWRSRLLRSTCRYELTNWQESSSTHRCECSRAQKLALNSGTTGGARKMASIPPKKPLLPKKKPP